MERGVERGERSNAADLSAGKLRHDEFITMSNDIIAQQQLQQQ